MKLVDLATYFGVSVNREVMSTQRPFASVEFGVQAVAVRVFLSSQPTLGRQTFNRIVGSELVLTEPPYRFSHGQPAHDAAQVEGICVETDDDPFARQSVIAELPLPFFVLRSSRCLWNTMLRPPTTLSLKKLPVFFAHKVNCSALRCGFSYPGEIRRHRDVELSCILRATVALRFC